MVLRMRRTNFFGILRYKQTTKSPPDGQTARPYNVKKHRTCRIVNFLSLRPTEKN